MIEARFPLLAALTVILCGVTAACSAGDARCVEEEETLARVAEAWARKGEISYEPDGELVFHPDRHFDSYRVALDRLPPGFPQDFPVYPGAEPLIAWVARPSEDRIYAHALWDITDRPDEVVSWYEGALKDEGWTDQKSAVYENRGWASACKQGLQAEVGVGETDGKPTIAVLISPVSWCE